MSNKDVLKFLEAIKKSEGTIFSCHFIKRGNGEYRKMVARLGVKKGVKGVGMKYDPIKKNLLPVFDMQKNAFRMIPFDAIEYLKVKGNEIAV